MEDPYSAMEGSTQEYSSDGSSGKVSWLLNKGLTVGKKILVTSFVISSAPVVLPPLVVISVLGLACSVPYGLLLASYACTNKIMSKLLPGSKPPPFLLGYGEVSYSFDEVENGRGEDVWHKGGIGVEEEEMLEDMRGRIEKRIELVEDANETVDENGYKEDVAEYEEAPSKIEVEVRIEQVGEDEKKESVTEKSLDQLPVNEMLTVVVDIEGDEKGGGAVEDIVVPFEVTDIVVDLCQNTEIKEDEELVKETRGLIEKMREDGMTDKGEKEKQSAENIPEGGEEGHQQVNRNVEEVAMPLEDSVGSQPLGEVEKNKDEVLKGSSKVQETEEVQNVHADYNTVRGEHNSAGAEVHSQEESGMTSIKAEDSEEKTWEQIEGMRKIVGYKAVAQATCIEEVKALYVFTGVEPPALFKEPADLAEVNDKLRFLMSIIGIK